MRHPFVLQFLGVCEHGPDIYIVTEYLSSGDVTALLESDRDVPWKLRLSIATQLCQAMIYLHAKSIIHRDLKPDNILIDEHENIRLADFGLARVLDTTTRERSLTICGTDGFIAPEVMLGMNYTAQCDVFSFGMVLAQLITRLEPGEDFWNRQQTGDLGLNDEEFIALVPAACPPELRDLTLGCGAFDADDRPLFTDIVEVLKYINTKMFGGSVRRAARRSRAVGSGDTLTPADKADMLIGTLSRKTLRETAPIVVPVEAPAAGAASSSSTSTTATLPKDEKSTQMLVFHVMKLVQRSTNEDYSDVPYAQDFLLSFVDFIHPAKLMNLLCQRWLAVPVPLSDASNEEREELDRRTKLIRLRYVGVSLFFFFFLLTNNTFYLSQFVGVCKNVGVAPPQRL
jgi:serine/threonine protein kinase